MTPLQKLTGAAPLVPSNTGTRTNEFQQAAMENGFQTREAEMNLAKLVYDMQGKTDV